MMNLRSLQIWFLLGVIAADTVLLNSSLSDEMPGNSSKKKIYFDPTRKSYFIPSHYPLRFLLEAQGLGTTPLTLTSPNVAFPVELAEGEYVLRIASASNVEYRIVSDNTPPETTYSFSKTPRKQVDGKVFFGRGLSIQVGSKDEASGLAHLFVSVNREPFRIIESPSTLTFPTDGEFDVAFNSIDNVGNVETTKHANFSVDTRQPSTQLRVFSKGNNQFLSHSSHFTLISADVGVGLSTTYYRIDQADWIRFSGEIPVETLKEGPHKLTYYSTDAVENKEKEKTFSFVYDSTPPDISYEWKGNFFNTGDLTYIRKSTELLTHSIDSTSGISYSSVRFGSEPEQTINSVVNFKNRDGTQSVTLRAVDRSGNETTKFLKVMIDQTPPQVEYSIKGKVIYSENRAVVQPGATLVVKALDTQSGLKSTSICEGTICSSAEQPYPLTLPGEHILNISAEDKVGNKVNRPPVILVVQAESHRAIASIQDSTHQWTDDKKFGAIGPIGEPFALYISDSPIAMDHVFKMEIGEDKLSFPTEGVSEIQIGFGEKRIKIKVPVDGQPPKSKVEFTGAHKFQLDNTTFYGAGLNVKLSSSDQSPSHIQAGVSSIQYALDDESFNTFKEPISRFQESRKYRLRSFAIDRVGNQEPSQECSFVIDLTPPITRLSWQGNVYADIISGSTYPELKAEDALSGVEMTNYSIDSENPKDFTTYLSKKATLDFDDLEDGTHILRFASIDRVKNRESMNTVSFRKDSTPPEVLVEFLGDAALQKKLQFIGKHAIFRIRATDEIAGVTHVRWRKSGGESKDYVSDVDFKDETEAFKIEVNAEDAVGNKTPWLSYPVRLDLTPPETTLTIKGLSYKLGDALYVKHSSKVMLEASDSESGVAESQYQIESGPIKNGKEIQLPAENKEFLLHFQSMDRVGNMELAKTMRIVVDDSPPLLQIKKANNEPLTESKDNIIPNHSYVHIVALDKGSGTKEILVSLDGHPEQLLKGPMYFSNPGKYVLKVKAVDWLENTSIKTVRLVVK